MNPPLTLGGWLRYDLIRRQLNQLSGVRSILEVGAGQGAVGARLSRRYDYTAVEPDEASFNIAARRLADRGRVLHGDVSALDPDARFDLVCAFEVLEHIEDDTEALRQWRRHIRPNGYLYISVPAFEKRYTVTDEWVGHYRRYEPRALAQVLEEQGLLVSSMLTYGFPLGNVLEWVRRRIIGMRQPQASLTERSLASGRWLQPPETLTIVTAAAALPFRWFQRPFLRTNKGIGLLALARQTETSSL